MALLAIVGPTASGKSEIAIEIAKKHDASILCCDSLLVYKNLNIGTAKFSMKELQGVLHFGVDLVDIDQSFTAGDYVRYAAPLIEQYVLENKNLIIVGGTGFYLKALLFGVWDAPPTQPKIRKELETKTSEELYKRLQSLDPAYAAKLMPQDQYRVIRALEIIETTKTPLSQILEKQNPMQLPYMVPVLGVDRAKIDLERRIIERTNKMFEKGLVQETKNLLNSNPQIPKSMFCVGYKQVVEFVQGKCTLQECHEKIVIATRQLAKKQKTFFKTFPQKPELFQPERLQPERLQPEPVRDVHARRSNVNVTERNGKATKYIEWFLFPEKKPDFFKKVAEYLSGGFAGECTAGTRAGSASDNARCVGDKLRRKSDTI